MIERFTQPAALWAFAIAVAFVPGIFASPFMPRYWAIALGLPWVSRLDPRSLSPVVMWCLVSFLAWAAVSLEWSPVLYGGMLPLFVLLLLFGVAIAGSEIVDRDAALIAFAIGLSVSSVLAVVQWFGYSPVVESSAPGGLFYNSEVLAEIAAPMFVWTFWKKLWPLTAAMAIPLVLCHSRVSWFIVAAGLIYGLKPRLRAVMFGLAVIVGAALVIDMSYGKAFSADERILLWGTAIRSMTFLGGGLGWWFQAHPFGQEEFAHSDILQAFVEFGVGGLFLAAVPVVIFFKSRGEVAERAAFLACCIEGVVSFPLHLPAEGFLFALLAGILASRRDGVRDRGLSRRTDYGAAVRRFAPYAATVVGFGGCFGEKFSLRPALAQYTHMDSFGGRKGRCRA